MVNVIHPEFKPVGLWKNPHLQTVYVTAFHNPPYLKASKKLFIPFDKHTQLMVEHNQVNSHKSHSTCVVLLHGLGGGSHGCFMVSTARKLLEAGFDTIRANMRTSALTLHLDPGMAHGGQSEDALAIIDYCINELNYESIILVGFSLGGGLALKTVGELGDKTPSQLKGVFTISAPVNVSACAHVFAQKKNILYDKFYLRKVTRLYLKKQQYFPEHIDLEVLKKIKKLEDFENYITVPAFNFNNLNHYYSSISADSQLQDIKVPTVSLIAKDDPVVPFHSIQQAFKQSNNTNLTLWSPPHGGHLGFRNSKKAAREDLDYNWAENRAVDFVKQLNKSMN